MLGKGRHIIVPILAVALLGFIASLTMSDDRAVSTPSIPKAEGGSCVADPSFVRTNHMVMLKHDRDLKLQDGVSDIDYSLKECISCHAVKDSQGEPVSYEDPKHFCRTCHDYAAVKVDCFSCHNSKPEDKAALIANNPHTKKTAYKLDEINWSDDKSKGKSDE